MQEEVWCTSMMQQIWYNLSYVELRFFIVCDGSDSCSKVLSVNLQNSHFVMLNQYEQEY
jgi:hypothetical protein